MSTIASQITSPMIVYSTVYPRRRSRKTSKLRITSLCWGNSPVTGEFSTQRASNAENVSIWWRHHVFFQITGESTSGSILRLTKRLNTTWLALCEETPTVTCFFTNYSFLNDDVIMISLDLLSHAWLNQRLNCKINHPTKSIQLRPKI